MFTLAHRSGKVLARPPIPTLQVRNTRSGFFEDSELRALLPELPEYLRPFVEFAYLTGWRANEARTLTWRQVDFATGIVRLEPGTTKNDEGREFPFGLIPELAALLEDQQARTSAFERESGAMVPWVFHLDGRPVGDYRDSWRSACKRAGCPGRLLHDLRRTAVRRMERAGVPRSVAMKLSGHKTESVYRRYAIVSPGDLADAARKLAALSGGTGIGSRKVVGIAEADSARTATVQQQFADSGRAEPRRRIAQAAAIPSRSDVAALLGSWRPQRDSNSCRRRERAVS